MVEMVERPRHRHGRRAEDHALHLRIPILRKGGADIHLLGGEHLTARFHPPIHLQGVDISVIGACEQERQGLLHLAQPALSIGELNDRLRLLLPYGRHRVREVSVSLLKGIESCLRHRSEPLP